MSLSVKTQKSFKAFSQVSRLLSHTAGVSVIMAGMAAMTPAVSAVVAANSLAFGESVAIGITPSLGLTVNVASGPLPTSSGAAPLPYSDLDTVLSAFVAGVLSTGVLVTNAASNVDGAAGVRFANASATVDDLAIAILGVLGLTAQQVSSTAQVSGSPGALTALGTTIITGLQLNGSTVLTASIAPNFVLLDLAGVKITLNEQTIVGDGTSNAFLSVDAIDIQLTNAAQLLLGNTLNGNIVIGHSEAGLAADPDPTAVPEPVSLLMLLTGLTGAAWARQRRSV